MRRLLVITFGPAMLALLAATVFAACGGGVDRATETDTRAPSPTITTSTTSAPPTDTSQAEPPDATPPTADQTSQSAEAHFVCPDGGMAEAEALQRAVDEGHQPWWLSAPDVAAACTFGIPGTAVEPAGTNRYRVSHPSSGESAMVEVAQPLGPSGIWVVTSVTPS
jgi:hypothetical protein